MSISYTKTDELANEICRINGIKEIKSCSRMNMGFNRAVYNINNDIVIKICINTAKEPGVINEASLLQNSDNDYMPKLYVADLSKKNSPYIYTIEEKINGYNLFDIWGSISDKVREEYLSNLIRIMKDIHQVRDCKEEFINKMLNKIDTYIDTIIDKKILPHEKIEYLNLLKEYLPLHFNGAKFGNVHGDIHFNNLIATDTGLKLIDYECYGYGPIDKEFDSINRMVRNPNSLIKNGLQEQVSPSDYENIMPYLTGNYPEICSDKNFQNRLLVYDCLNSLKWIIIYPEHKQYHDILFTESKKLIK